LKFKGVKEAPRCLCGFNSVLLQALFFFHFAFRSFQYFCPSRPLLTALLPTAFVYILFFLSLFLLLY